MSFHNEAPINKHCFVYCGDDECNCYANPKYKDHEKLTYQNVINPATFNKIATPVKVGPMNDSGIGIYDSNDKILLTVHWIASVTATVEDAIALAQKICTELNRTNHLA